MFAWKLQADHYNKDEDSSQSNSWNSEMLMKKKKCYAQRNWKVILISKNIIKKKKEIKGQLRSV